MPIHAPHNLYRGVNPHLMSLLQTRGTRQKPSLFEGFHSAHIGHIRVYLNQRLPPNYIADSEQSLQVRSAQPDNPRPDVSIMQLRPAETGGRSAQGDFSAPTWEGELVLNIAPEEELMAVVIRQAWDERVVARIELLSPSNKAGGTHHLAYHLRREECLKNVIPLIEVDYLHEQPPIIPDIPRTYPYTIAVSDPRPAQHSLKVFGAAVHQPLARLLIPLAEGDTVVTDFDQIFQTHFQQDRLWLRVDYAQIPARFDTYSADDQTRIRARMAEIAAEYGES